MTSEPIYIPASKEIVPSSGVYSGERDAADVAAENIALARDLAAWQARVAAAEEKMARMQEELDSHRGVPSETDKELNIKWDEKTPHDHRISVRYHDWFRIQRTRVCAENERDARIRELAAIRDEVCPDLALYHDGELLRHVRRLVTDNRELVAQVHDARDQLEAIRDEHSRLIKKEYDRSNTLLARAIRYFRRPGRGLARR